MRLCMNVDNLTVLRYNQADFMCYDTDTLLVKFAHRKARSAVLAARSQFKGSNIYINEHLTTSAAVLFAAARKLVKSKKLLGPRTLNGRAVVKFLANGAENVMTVNNNS